MSDQTREFKRIKKKLGTTKLLAVSKFQSIDRIQGLINLGQADFAENRVQELKEKAQELKGPDVRWHFIGQLQRNKVKDLLKIPGLTSIQSVDRLELVEELVRFEMIRKRPLEIFLQINTSLEEQKGGFTQWEEALQAAKVLSKSQVFVLKGLMTIAVADSSPLKKEARTCFQKLRKLSGELTKKFPQAKDLSMGMSNDWEIAVDEGSTHVRLGTILFGPREG